MKKNNLLMLVFLVTFINGKAQEKYSNIILGYSEEQEMHFHQYNPPLKIKADYSSVSEVENKYPEQLIQSILSATTQEWVDFNTLGGTDNSRKKKDSHFQKIKMMNKDKNYFILHHKLTFRIGEIPTVIIKFFFYQENESPISGAFVMQNINGRWFKTTHPSVSTLSIIIMRLKTEVLKGIVLGGSDDKDINGLKERVAVNGIFSTDKLIEEFSRWYSPKKDEYKLKLYTDSDAW